MKCTECKTEASQLSTSLIVNGSQKIYNGEALCDFCLAKRGFTSYELLESKKYYELAKYREELNARK